MSNGVVYTCADICLLWFTMCGELILGNKNLKIIIFQKNKLKIRLYYSSISFLFIYPHHMKKKIFQFSIYFSEFESTSQIHKN